MFFKDVVTYQRKRSAKRQAALDKVTEEVVAAGLGVDEAVIFEGVSTTTRGSGGCLGHKAISLPRHVR